MTIKGLDEYSSKLSKLGKDAPEIAKKVVMSGASPVADEIRKNLENNLYDPAYAGTGDGGIWGVKRYKFKGDLLNSFGIAPPGVDSHGNTNTKIGFEGYDSKGVPNALKARAMESGTSTLRKRPFVRPAVNSTKAKAIKEMGRKLDEEMKIYAL
ncbi:HK97-gp10 family putative phage morphogenesis protein [Clostridium sp. BSD9I1]|uniref:HK97-gp10 family putative phage morphogenesis protein n=1 Tax=Clostridium sp. BSD9I1 TaxID=2003589 RepID=UPI001FA8BFE8|nr:HK97-gp10 family putative phage morphogenesis protein [Clostridium sp. BSD9I1]